MTSSADFPWCTTLSWWSSFVTCYCDSANDLQDRHPKNDNQNEGGFVSFVSFVYEGYAERNTLSTAAQRSYVHRMGQGSLLLLGPQTCTYLRPYKKRLARLIPPHHQVPTNMPDRVESPIFTLPNELLAEIMHFLGPPDLSRAEPGWLVLPAICKLLREVAHTSPNWNSGSSDHTDDFYTSYGWHECAKSLAVEHYEMMDERVGAFWVIHPLWKAGSVDYLSGSLYLRPHSCDSEAMQTMNRYLTSAPLLSQPPRLNLTWMRRITLVCTISDAGDAIDFSPEDVPCLVAPALEELILRDYIVDWQCSGLVVLNISLDGIAEKYGCTHLFKHLEESRLSLQSIVLSRCLLHLSFEEMNPEDHLSPILFPSLDIRGIVLRDAPSKTWWMRQKMTLPYGIEALFAGPRPSHLCLKELADLSVAAISHVSCPECVDPDIYGPITAINFDDSREGLDYACSIIGYTSHEHTHVECSPSGIGSDRDQLLSDDKGQACAQTDLRFAFEMYSDWDIAAWDIEDQPDVDTAIMRNTVLGSVEDIYIRGDLDLLADEDGVATWTAVLCHFPKARRMHISAPTDAALAPLCDSRLLPTLERVRLSSATGYEEWEVDAAWLLRVCERRKELQEGDGPPLSLRIDSGIRVVGDPETVRKLRESSN
ncbi:hypothetical protein PENSPDRAFT_105279 [Peniophora sp. CONT]|nr:hypothetical protein PENSPDRAFT_105279 [Peniophora sp. CONT]